MNWKRLCANLKERGALREEGMNVKSDCSDGSRLSIPTEFNAEPRGGNEKAPVTKSGGFHTFR